jgi:hypothetical protein
MSLLLAADFYLLRSIRLLHPPRKGNYTLVSGGGESPNLVTLTSHKLGCYMREWTENPHKEILWDLCVEPQRILWSYLPRLIAMRFDFVTEGGIFTFTSRIPSLYSA